MSHRGSVISCGFGRPAGQQHICWPVSFVIPCIRRRNQPNQKVAYAVTAPNNSDAFALVMTQIKTADASMNPVIMPSWAAAFLMYSKHQSGATSITTPPQMMAHFSNRSKKLSAYICALKPIPPLLLSYFYFVSIIYTYVEVVLFVKLRRKAYFCRCVSFRKATE
jgi:hypothetical protein